MNDDERLVTHLYERFNARDMEAVLSTLARNVTWANGIEGIYVHGPEAVREYWTHQWSIIDPQVEPVRVSRSTDGSIVVQVHQIVHDRKGQLLIDETVTHVFRLQDGLVTQFDIQGDTQLSTIQPSKVTRPGTNSSPNQGET